MPMSRQDYRAVAEVLREAIDPDDPATEKVVRTTAQQFADLFKRDDTRFDRQRFFAAVFQETS